MADKIKTGETWFVRLPNATCLSVVEVTDITKKTVEISTDTTRRWAKSRYIKSEVKFVELVITT